jgi:adenylylsulfate kinase-like enzyme
VFAVIVTGAPGSGKTVTATALSDALIVAEVEHASGDVDELAWSFPFPDLAGRCAHLRVWAAAHRAAGRDLLLVAEVIESQEHLGDVLSAVGADDHLLVRLDAPVATMRERIVEREPPGWFGLEHLVGEVEPLERSLDGLDGVHLTLDTERLSLAEVVERIRKARPELLLPTR